MPNEISFEDMLGTSEETGFESMLGPLPKAPAVPVPDVVPFKPEAPSVKERLSNIGVRRGGPFFLEIGAEALKPRVTEADLLETKESLGSVLVDIGMLPKHLAYGGMDFALSLPGFITGVYNAGLKMAKYTYLPWQRVAEGDVPEFTIGKLADVAEEGMEESQMFFEPGKELLLGKPTPQSQMVGQVIMAPLNASAELGRVVKESEWAKEHPNLSGLARFASWGLGFLTLGAFLHGGPGRAKVYKDTNKVLKDAAGIIEKEKVIETIPDEALKNAQKKLLEIEKKQVELEAAAVAEEIKKAAKLDKPIKEDLKKKGEEVKIAKGDLADSMPWGEEPGPVPIGKLKLTREDIMKDLQGFKDRIEKLEKKPAKDKKSVDKINKEIEHVRGLARMAEEALMEIESPAKTPISRMSVEELNIARDNLVKLRKQYKDEGMEFEAEQAQLAIDTINEMLSGKKVVERIGKDSLVERGKEIERELDEVVEPVIDLDRQTGTPTPKKLKGESSPFFATKEETEALSKLYEDRLTSIREDPELFTQYLINNVRRWYHGEEQIDIGRTRDNLSKLASRADELRMDFLNGADHLAWKETVSDAAEWARGLERRVTPEGPGFGIYIGIPPGLPKAIKGLYEKAKGLAEKGMEWNEIRKRTGWFPSPYDKKWRFELDDSKAKFKRPWEEIEKQDLFDKDAYKLEEILDHPTLFKAYPELKELRVQKKGTIQFGLQGSFNPESKTVHITNWLSEKDAMDTLLHELQHWVQYKEKFATGGSERTSRIFNVLPQLERYYTRLSKTKGQYRGDRERAKNKLELVDEIKKKEDEFRRIADEIEELTKQRDEIDKSMQERLDKIDELLEGSKKEADALYSEIKELRKLRKLYRPGSPEWKDASAKTDRIREKWNAIVNYRTSMFRKWNDLHSMKMDKVGELESILEPLKERQREAEKPYEDIKYDAYRLLAGEVEARDTGARAALDYPSRKHVPPYKREYEYVLPEEAIVTFERARGLERKVEKGGVQLNMMIPLDQVPKAVRDFFRGMKGLVKADISKPTFPGTSRINLEGTVYELRAKDAYRNKELFDETGFWLGRDGKWRYEIDDSKAKLDIERLKTSTIDNPAQLSDILDLPELYKAVPGIERTNVYFRNIGGVSGRVGGLQGMEYIDINPSTSQRRATLLHEVQHLVNTRTGAFEGSNYAEAGGRANYMKVPGEIEARLAEARMEMSKEQRVETPPWKTLDEMLLDEGVIGLEDFERIGAKTYSRTGTKLYSFPAGPLEVGAKQIIKWADEARAAAKKARAYKRFRPIEGAKAVKEEAVRGFVDRSGNVKSKFIKKQGQQGYKIVQKMSLVRGSNAQSISEIYQMRKELASGMSRRAKEVAFDLVFNKRMNDIAGYKTRKQFKFPEGSDPDQSTSYLAMVEYMPEVLAKKEGIKVSELADAKKYMFGYFDWMKKKLVEMEREGLISAKEREKLESHNYAKLMKVSDILDRKTEITLGGKKITVRDSGLERLQRGKTVDILERDSEILALEHFNIINGRIMRNRANRELKKLAEKDPENPFVSLKKKSGWSEISVFEKGEKESLYISPLMAREWVTSTPEISYRHAKLLKYITGTPVLKTFATGIDWGFAVANMPRDLQHIYRAARYWEDGKWHSAYSELLPIYIPQIGKDIASVFTDVINTGPKTKAYLKYGGGMEWLSAQGFMFKRGKHLESNLNLSLRMLGEFGRISEMTTRVAITEHMIRKRARERGISVEEARKNRDIMEEAVFVARDYMDFAQGGGHVKAMDNGIPYLGATVVATRTYWRDLKDRPVSFLWKTAQIVGLVTGIYHAMRTISPKTTEDLQGSIDAQNNLCIPFGDDAGWEDEKGQMRYFYWKIPLDPGQKHLKALTEAAYDKTMGYEVDVDRVTRNLAELSPVGISSLPPIPAAIIQYWTNKDFWTEEPAYKGGKPFPYTFTDAEGKWRGSSGEYTARTPQAFRDLGEITRLSPERSKVAVGELTTSSTMWGYLMGVGYDKLFKDLPPSKKRQHWAMVLAKLPVTGRFIGVTHPYSKHAASIDKSEAMDAYKTHMENVGLEILSDGHLYEGVVGREAVMDYIYSQEDVRVKDRLRDRFFFEEKILDRKLPNRSWWIRLQRLSPEVRALEYYKESLKPQRAAELARGKSIIGATGGFFTKDFYRELSRLEELEE